MRFSADFMLNRHASLSPISPPFTFATLSLIDMITPYALSSFFAFRLFRYAFSRHTPPLLIIFDMRL